MYEKRYTKEDGTEVIEKFEGWVETIVGNFWIGFWLAAIGIACIVLLPFTAIYKWFYPTLLSHSTHRTSLFNKCNNDNS